MSYRVGYDLAKGDDKAMVAVCEGTVLKFVSEVPPGSQIIACQGKVLCTTPQGGLFEVTEDGLKRIDPAALNDTTEGL